MGCYTLAYLLEIQQLNIPFFFDTALCAMPFFAIGHLVNQKGYLNKSPNIYLSFACILLYTIIIIWQRPDCEMYRNEFPFYFLPMSLMAIYGLYGISEKLAHYDYHATKFVRHCGVISLVIFGLHGPITEILLPAINKFTTTNYIKSIIIIFISLIATFYINKIIMKYCPVLIGKKKK